MKIKNTLSKVILAQILMMVCASVASAQYVQLLAYTNYTWRYNDTSTSTANPQGLFQATDFDDSGAGWKTGRALFGNDDNGIYNTVNHPFSGGINGFATPLDRSNGRVTFYFRTHFNVSAIVPGATLYSTNYLDDGAVFYINGTEVGRTRLPGGDITWSTLGSNPTEGAPTRVDMPASALVVGDNVLAVEVHQSAAASSDAAFGMNLIMINPFHPVILDLTQPADVTVVENRSFTLRCLADASPPITYQWVHDGTDILGANSPTYSVALAASGDAGDYYCRVSNPVGSTNSRTAHVTFIEDDVAPLAVGAVAGNFTSLTVQFNEGMEASTTGDLFGWGVTDGVNTFEISAITLSADGSVATLTFAPGVTLAEDTAYSVSISGPNDLAFNQIIDTNLTFRSFTSAGCSGFLFEAFDTSSTAGNAVSLLTSHPNYPNNPRDVARAPSFDSRHAYSNDTHEQYGGRIRGLFVPTVSGPWTFYLASDDGGELWVNPNGPEATGRQLVAFELNCCNNFLPQGDPRTSVPLNLQAGQPYYVEALYKEGTGGDWLKVAARPSSEPVPPGGNSDQAGLTPTAIQGGAGPAGILGHITIAGQPASITRNAGTIAEFAAQLSSDVPGCYQWKRNGTDIAGAIGPRYRLTATPGDDQAKFSVVISLMGGTILTSSEATLTVINDTTGPTLLSASTDPYATNVVVVFNEPIDPTTGASIANYQVDSGAATVTGAVVSGSNVTVTVSTPLAPCASHTVRVSAVRDIYNNVIVPNPSTVSFLTPMLLIALDANKTWRYNDTGANLGTDWRTKIYDDSGWPQGPGVLAFESAALAAPIRTVTIDPRTLPTAGSANYFRTHFDLPTDPSTITSLQIRYLVDDGLVLFINGTEVHRNAMPTGETYDTFSTRTVGDATAFEVFDIPTTALVSGDNVMAASVHQVNAGSSDMVFGLEMTAAASACIQRPRLSIAINGNQVTITSTAPGGTIHRASNIDGPWSVVGAAPQTVTVGPGQEFFEIR